MSKKDETPKEEAFVVLAMSDLVGEALEEYYEKREQVISELEARARALFTRIAPEHAPFSEFYLEDDEHVFCEVVDLADGFGTLSLSFHKGATPEADYFLVENYMELPSQIRIYYLYDLGRALCELTEMAGEVLQSFKHVVLDGAQCPMTSKQE
jgi:hypothetical protein